MNKYLQSLLLLAIILCFEAIPYFWDDSFSFQDMHWGWIIVLPIVLFIKNIYTENKRKNQSE